MSLWRLYWYPRNIPQGPAFTNPCFLRDALYISWCMVGQECNTNQHDMFCISSLTLCTPVCLTCLYFYAADTPFYDKYVTRTTCNPKTLSGNRKQPNIRKGQARGDHLRWIYMVSEIRCVRSKPYCVNQIGVQG